MSLRNVIREYIRDMHLPIPPFWMVAAVLILVVLTWVPLALIALARVTPSSKPRIHLFQDMDEQPKLQTQGYTIIFEDHRAMREPVAGTVARGELEADDHFYRGYRLVEGPDGEPQPKFFSGMPERVTVDQDFLLRGQDRFNVYCFPCHGMGAYGNGPVHQRVAQLLEAGGGLGTTWIQPSNLHTLNNKGQLQYGPELYPDGKLFNTITHGIRNMPAYGDQIAVEDRWAIVTYIRALQLTQYQPQNQDQTATP